MKVILKNVILTFPVLDEPRGFQDDDNVKYSAVFLLDKKDPQLQVIEKVIKEQSEELWKLKAPSVLAKITTMDRVCLRDGDTKEYAGFSDRMYITAKNKIRPVLKNKDKSDANHELFYAGCKVNAVIDLYAFDKKAIQCVSATLLGIQFVEDGDSLAGARLASDADFENLAMDAENDLF